MGALLILSGEALSFNHVLPWSRYVFPLFWYGYILLLDSLNLWLRGRSLLSDRPREFLLMLPASAFYWYIFEGYNSVIENWVYINTPPEKWVELSMKVISFATVIPAMYETAELVGGRAGLEADLNSRPFAQGGRNFQWVSLLGLVLAALPFLFPRLFFWSVWLGVFFLLDPINARLGLSSLLCDWRRGDLRRTGVLLAAGYICGFFWEFWNYWAYTKWIYTVPVPDMPHIFEMPALGFLGFGPFALETFAFWTFLWRERK